MSEPQTKSNWQDPSSLWITLEPTSGTLSVDENAPINPAMVDPATGIPLARSIARGRLGLGGR